MSSTNDDPFYLDSPLYSPCPSPGPAPAPATDLATEVSTFVAALGLQPRPDPGWDDNYTWQLLHSGPFTTLHRGTHLTSILFDDGRSRVVETFAVDAFARSANHTRRDSAHMPSAPPPPPPPLLSPAPSPAFNWRPSWQPLRPPTPYRPPDSPPTPTTTNSPHRDISYSHDEPRPSFRSVAHQSSSVPVPAPVSQWRQAQEDEHARPVVHTPWQPFR